VRSAPGLALTVLHGVRSEEDLFYRELFRDADYQPCISKGRTTCFAGRVTARLQAMQVDPKAHYYLCGANAMITEAFAILAARGIAADHIFSEPYYFW
jgi:ferredoxin-NADP reductase